MTPKNSKLVIVAIISILIIVVILISFYFGGDGDKPSQALDQQLRVVLKEAGITQLDPGPTPDPAKVALGEALFFDKELSGNRDISCATCHHPTLQTCDRLSLSIGTGAKGLGESRELGHGREFVPRNAPDLFYRGSPDWTSMFWDSRVVGTKKTGFISPAGDMLPDGLDNVLAVQAMFPVTSRDEMRGDGGDVDVFNRTNELAEINDTNFTAIWDDLMQRLLENPEYVALFNEAYTEVPTEELGFEDVANAIADFEIYTFSPLDSPWDSYLEGDDSPLSDDAKRGALLFYGEAGCSKCHSGNLFTDQRNHNTAVPQIGPGKGAEAPLDLGRARITRDPSDNFAFRTPPLRNVALTGPWMHDGAFTTLEGVIRHYMDPEGALRNYDVSQLDPELQDTFQGDEETISAILKNLDPFLQNPPNLSDEDVDDIIAFLEALTDHSMAELHECIPESVPSRLPLED
ncbi:MAG: cytochrome c peroxidase [Halobacteriota archaeon]|nr:cytochrome c peroxidase [Halobacteriota archaeon]